MTLSVVIPAWNAADTLGETLESVAAQTRAPEEVIVVVDGATDGTEGIARAHPAVTHVLVQENAGAAAAINTGIAASAGTEVAVLDADDLWPPGSLAARLEALSPGVEAVLGRFDSFLCPSVPPEAAARLSWRAGEQAGFVFGAGLYRRAVLDRIGPFDATLRTGFFVEWFGRAEAAGLRLRHIPTLTLRRRVRPGTLSRRSAGESRIARDMLEIARRRIAARRGGDA
ncbi:MAG: glycosyltransferase family A protein [Pseudomonadota bacterium]